MRVIIAIAAFAIAAAMADVPAPRSLPIRLELSRKHLHGAEISGTITLTPAMGPAAPVTVACCDDGMALALPANSAWQLQPHLHGGWAAREMIVIADRPAVHTMTLWPAVHVKGRVQVEKGVELPHVVTLTLLDPPGHATGIPPGNTVDCTLGTDGTFDCELPALKLDLAFGSAGYVSRQVWDLDLHAAGVRDVGQILLRKGATVSGWVQNGGGVATVAVVPLIASSGAVTERVARPLAKTVVLKNGFFQIAGVGPGKYAIRVERAGFATETVMPVPVYGGRETAIRKMIVLRPPVSVTVSVNPPRDWQGEPWALWIAKASPISGGFDAAPIFEGRVDDGHVVLKGQSAGRFSVDVADSRGNPLKNEQFDVDGAGDAAREIRVDVITVRGTVQLGDAPLETTLWFGGRYGAQHATMRSDAKGNFYGVLPHDGEWRVTAAVDGNDVETTASVRARDGEAAVNLTLPDNRVTGVVVDHEGNPVAAADVTLMTARASMTHRTERNGEFTFRAIEEGNVSLAASVRREEKLLTSDAAMTTVSAEGSPPPVQLTLHEGDRFTGTVKSINGPIAGAAVTVLPVLDQTIAATATTDLDGHFKTFVPGDADRAYVTVRPPGYALRVFDVPLPNHGISLNVPSSGGTLDIVFPKAPAANVALLLFQDGRPLPLPEVARWAMSHGTPPSDSGIHAADMAPALYQACIGAQQLIRREELGRWIGSARCVTGTLVPFGTLRLEIASAGESRH